MHGVVTGRQSRGTQSNSRLDRSLGWIDAAAEPDAISSAPRDYMEAIVSSVVSAVPALKALHEQRAIDVVEFFSHDRPQDAPQWFHFDTAEYARFDAPGFKTVHNPSHSVIVYLTDEQEAHFGLLGPRHNCSTTDSTTDGGVAVTTDDVEMARRPESRTCTPDELATPVPSRVASTVLVRPRAGRILFIDGAELHGTLPGARLPHRRALIGLCFFRNRPALPPTSPVGTLQGRRATEAVFALPDALATTVATVAIDAHGAARATQGAGVGVGGGASGGGAGGGAGGSLASNGSWAEARGAAPRKVADLREGDEIRTFSASEVAALHAADEAAAGELPQRATRPSGTTSRWQGLAPSRATAVQIQINRRPIWRTLRLPPARTLATECEVCAVELDPPLDLALQRGE